jgi:hemerythrin-like domain-containing protein
MGALDSLRREHEVILEVVGRMENAAKCREGDLPVRFLLAAVDFLHVFVDKNHHGKEEQAVFPMMRVNPALAELAALLAEEHEEGRRLTTALERLLQDSSGHAEFVATLHDYVQLIRDHVFKENELIFVAAEAEFSDTDAAELARAFTVIEEDALGSDGLLRLLKGLEHIT